MAITDQTWAQLDPSAGRLSDRQQRTLRWMAATVVTALALGFAAAGSGAAGQRLSLGDSTSSRSGNHTIAFTVRLRNDGRFTEHIRSAGRSGSGLVFTGADGLPTDLLPSTSVDVTLHYRVVDCSEAPKGQWRIPVRTEQFWGVRTRWLDGPSYLADDAPSDYSYSGSDDPYEVPWQAEITKRACG